MSRDLVAEVAFLTRALKAPTLREAVPRLADRAREPPRHAPESAAERKPRAKASRRRSRAGDRALCAAGYRFSDASSTIHRTSSSNVMPA